MNCSLRSVVHDLGWLLQVPGWLAVPAIAVAVLNEEWVACWSLAGMAAGAAITGLLLSRLEPGESSRADAMRTTAAGWLLLGAVSSIPFFAWSLLDPSASAESRVFSHWAGALFEGMSGITSTGLTMVADPATLPMSLQLWRTLLEWIGGVGVVVLALAFADLSIAPEALYRAEARSRRLGSSIRSTGRRIWGLYGAFSVAAVSALWLSGASPWTALNHGLTGISTGGFTIHADSLASTDFAQRLVLMVVMLVGATSFSLFHAVLVKRRWSALARCVQLPVFVGLVAAGAVLVAWLEPGLGLVDAAFQWTSAVATCGFSVVPPEQMSDAALASMAVGMLIGGMVGSTAGGLKIERLVVLGQALWRRMLRRPARVQTDDGWFEGDDARERVRTALKLLVLIVASVSVGIVALAAVDEAQRPLVHHIFEATSAIGCVGLSAGVANADLSTGGKLVLIVLMWVGRLEVVAVLTLVASPFRVHQEDWLPGFEADGRPGSSPQEPEPSLQEPHDP